MAWIRTQDKTEILDTEDWCGFLIDGNKLSLIFSREVTQGWCGKRKMHTDAYCIGKFSTPERALEELNRIHNWIALKNAQGVYQVSAD